MFSVFRVAFEPIFIAVLQIFIIVLFGGFLVRKKIFEDVHITSIANLVVKVFLPCLIVSSFVKKLDTQAMPWWWVVPIATAGLICSGFLISYLLFIKEVPKKNNMLALSSLQNAAYLSLPLLKIAYPDHFEKMALYVFLCVLAVSPIMWSLGKVILTSSNFAKINWRDFVTPPFCANIVAIFLVLTGLKEHVPVIFFSAAELLGAATVPCSMIVLGASLGAISLSDWAPIWDIIRVLSVKLVILPALMIGALIYFNIKESYPLLCIVLIIQASSAPATNLMIQVRNYGGDVQKVGSIMLIAYVACMFVIPFWVGVWQVLI